MMTGIVNESSAIYTTVDTRIRIVGALHEENMAAMCIGVKLRYLLRNYNSHDCLESGSTGWHTYP